MKKYICLLAMILLAQQTVLADMMEDVANQANQMISVWENLYTCTPINDGLLEIYGYSNNLCHFKYVDYDCNVPSDVAKRYALNNINMYKKIIENANFSTSTNSMSTGINDSIHRTYCKGY